MRKTWLPILLLAAIVLSACAPATSQAPAATAVTPTQPAPAAPTTAAIAPAAGGAMQCSLESTLPTPSPTQVARFAPVTDQDWTLGSKDARVTLLEYSDFM